MTITMAASYLPLSKEKGSTTDVWDHDRQAERDWDSDVIHADRNFGGRGSRTLRSCSGRSAGWILQVLCVVKVFFYLGCAILGWPVATFGTLLQRTGILFWTRDLPEASHVVFPKIGISRKNWDFRQNIWISGARGHLKSPKKRPEIHKNARNPDFCEIPIFGKPHGKGPDGDLVRKK